MIRCIHIALLLIAIGGAGAATARADMDTTAPRVARREAFFGLHFDLHPGPQDTALGRDTSVENLAALLDRVKPDFVQYDCKGHSGYTGYPTKVGTSSPGIVRDALAVWRAETRKRGIGLFIHYCGVWDTAALKLNPEWACVGPDGIADPDITSNFSTYTKELMIPQLKEAIELHDLDGVWADGECWASKLDYGPAAMAAWKAETGQTTAPLKADDKGWQPWKAFHRRAFENHVSEWVDALHDFRPSLELCSNWAYTPHMPVPVKSKVDFLSGDYSPKYSVDRARFEARYLDSTGMPWDLMAWGFNGLKNWSGSPPQKKPAIQLQQEAAAVLAQGGGMQVYYQPTRSGYVSDFIIDTLGQVSDFCRARQSFSHKTKSVPQVALMLSSESFLAKSGDVYKPGDNYVALEGMLHALLENHYSVELMAEHTLLPKITDYPLVVIADAHRLTRSTHRQLLQYVQNGGQLLLGDRVSSVHFYEQLGAKSQGEPIDENAYVGGPDGTACVPGLWERVDPGEADVLAFRTDTEGDATTGVVAVIGKTVGKGRIIAALGPIGDAFYHSHHPHLRRWLGQLADKMFTRPAVLLEGPHDVDVALRRLQDLRLVVHLTNNSGAPRAERFIAIDSIPFTGPMVLRLKTDSTPKSIRWMPEDTELVWRMEGGNAVIEVPSLHIHGAVLVTP